MKKYTIALLVVTCSLAIVSEAREKMGLIELIRTTKKICNKKSDALWEVVIRCHDPITDDFNRKSDEARCTRTSSDPDPTNTSVPMQRVFKTFCNAVDWNPFHFIKSLVCLAKGHDKEVKTTQKLFGEDVPQNIVRCIRGIDFTKY